MGIRRDFPYETAHDDVRIPLPDGTPLYARVWRPVTDAPVPALLEYLPYRLTDWTAPRDAQRHPWYAGHGYASVRVDLRGHGNSGGLPGEPHDATELADALAVVDWLAGQPWCTGRVGMFGGAWGGLAALRVAALAPEPLRAVVVAGAPDDPYGDGVLRKGGAVLAAGLPVRSATLLACVCRPPDPVYAGPEWRELWLRRLEAVRPCVHTWPAPAPGRAEAARADLSGIRAAVLAVAGWQDPYRNTVLRLVEALPPDRVRGILGPWSHQYPDRGLPPGPSIGFLQETLRWWDRHLKDAPRDATAEPLLRSWITASHPPAARYEELPGRWVADPSWPSPHVAPVRYALGGAPVPVRSPQRTGLDAGRLLPCGQDADLPPDQRDEDAGSVCFDVPVPAEGPALEILGRPRAVLALRRAAPTGQVAARLCDVAPDGASTLVTRGVLDLSHGSGPAVVDLDAAGYAFSPGHRVRLAVSSAYWPWVWPRPDAAGFVLDPAGSSLILPVRSRGGDGVEFAPPEHAEPLEVVEPATLDEPRPERLVVRDVAKDEWRLETVPPGVGTRVHPDGLEVTEEALETAVITGDDPLSARTRSDWSIRLHRPEDAWDVRVTTRSELTCDAEAFLATDEVICTEGAEVVFHRTWEKRVPRTAG
ncbi:CocE/NonD family hydrolase [Streptomyces tritici]|uniref:CocE/NonD family hydrolase n=1 Tax=Streptomyces tritici TaxID=2054410 RepID=UPI003AF15EC5